ncbi:CHAD domain-containing protein [Luteibacter aegosomatissinici]|uniref:CHAD domain-containing protein n=1 Tax=Luteibacter aegosomatissinici TaxID=2911539 RepID=UPI001FF77257|nr:CHAD domain-containing protein [Luteibacter aegosomatissinici]UPG92509.1 CHAD domain-containing protein [Luteibacter aegosomatissinici]
MPPKSAPSIPTALALFASRECRSVARSLANTKDRHAGIHAARKGLRRLKSLLRLGADVFGANLADIEGRIGKLAASLSPLRDAHVAVTLAHTLAGPRPSAAWAEAITTLEHRRDGRLIEALQKDPRFLKRRHAVRELGDMVERLPWRLVKRGVVESTLDDQQQRVVAAGKRVRKDASPGNLHRWRRRARRLRMQLQYWRRVLRAANKTAHHRAKHDKASTHAMSKLSDALGAKQDLRALRVNLRALKKPALTAPLTDQIAEELKKHRKL